MLKIDLHHFGLTFHRWCPSPPCGIDSPPVSNSSPLGLCNWLCQFEKFVCIWKSPKSFPSLPPPGGYLVVSLFIFHFCHVKFVQEAKGLREVEELRLVAKLVLQQTLLCLLFLWLYHQQFSGTNKKWFGVGLLLKGNIVDEPVKQILIFKNKLPSLSLSLSGFILVVCN